MIVNVTTQSLGTTDLDEELYRLLKTKAMQLGGHDNVKERVRTNLVRGPDQGKGVMHSEFEFKGKQQARDFLNWVLEMPKVYTITISRHPLRDMTTIS